MATKPLPFSRRLASALEAAGLSVSGLAKASGVPRQQIHEYISYGTIPRADTLAKIAKALGVTMDSLFPD
jgi:transcriptional regulator with XRE-family HTH domain